MAATKRYQALHELTDPQQRAIDALIGGATHAKAAEAAGAHRVTVTKWANKHPAFRAELNRRREELRAERQGRMLQLDGLALDALAECLEEGDTKTALAWVKLRGIGADATVGSAAPTDPDQVIYKEMIDQARALKVKGADLLLFDATDRGDLQDRLVEMQEELARELGVDS